MADVFKTPGVYVKEIPSFPPSIAEVETAIPAFIGYTEKAGFNGLDLVLKPTRITNLLDYEVMFGVAQKEKSLSVIIDDTTDSSGNLLSRSITATGDSAKQARFKMYNELQMFFANGGGPCYIVSVGKYETITSAAADSDIVKGDLTKGLTEIAKFDEPTLLAFPDATALSNSDYNVLMGEALSQCSSLQDRFTVMDVKPKTGGTNIIDDSMNDFRNAQLMESTTDKLKYGAAYFPFINTALNFRYDEADVPIVYKKNGVALSIDDVTSAAAVSAATAAVAAAALTADPGDDVKAAEAKTAADAAAAAAAETDVVAINVATIKTPPLKLDNEIKTALGLKKPDGTVTGNTELYNMIKTELNKVTATLPPSGAVLGQYATVDASRGVWKAPANVSLSAANSAAIKISHNDQMNLNVDPTSGKSINAIRYFTGKGLLIWGSRTLAGNDNEWRYVPVRRFFNFAEESIKKGSEWVVFEPNDANTWVRVKAMIENFLLKQWRAGALAGAKPEHAFFVKVGLGVTMTALDILEGRMNIEIGMAVVRPAEFIILKFSHKLQES
jgi:uncharacterized protein